MKTTQILLACFAILIAPFGSVVLGGCDSQTDDASSIEYETAQSWIDLCPDKDDQDYQEMYVRHLTEDFRCVESEQLNVLKACIDSLDTCDTEAKQCWDASICVEENCPAVFLDCEDSPFFHPRPGDEEFGNVYNLKEAFDSECVSYLSSTSVGYQTCVDNKCVSAEELRRRICEYE